MNFYCFDSIFLCIYENNHLPNLRILPEFLQFFELIVLDLNFLYLLHPPSRKLMTPIMIINLTFILFLSNYNISYKKSIFLIYLKISSRFIFWNFICSLTFNTVSQIYPLVTFFSDCHFMSE